MRNPIVLVADDEPATRLFASRVLQKAGWHVVEAADGEAAVALAMCEPVDLVVMDIDMPRLDGCAATAQIRAAGGAIASVPILAYSLVCLDDGALAERGFDGRLPKPCAPEALLAAVSAWHPSVGLADTQRLKAVFGEDELTPLIARFRDQLVEALAALDTGDTGMAHRIAGVAGTLGFAQVSESWLRLSEGDGAARDDARRLARLAIAAIDRDAI
ncbi:MAG: response regulator [Sphingomonas sp.]|uniref:response regulator n=1 Tax=Sphingomonas sp. TaxID=28214 RepID=UPI001AC4F1E9|nr:response regulator [Sphingomonas sp.]MBN8809331.1 response regulator [Sphingomonas sp.]